MEGQGQGVVQTGAPAALQGRARPAIGLYAAKDAREAVLQHEAVVIRAPDASMSADPEY